MAKKPTYADALRILGKDDSAVLDLAEQLVEASAGAVGVPDLFGLRGEIIAKGRGLLTGIREKITGVSRWDRTQRVDAANRVLVVVSALEALDETLEKTDPDSRELSDDALADLTRQILDSAGAAVVTAHTPRGEPDTIPNALSLALTTVIGSSAVPQGLLRSITEKTTRRYGESYRRLAADVPEFGVWANLAEHERTQTELATGLAELEELLVELSPGNQAQRHMRELHTLYRRALWRPVLTGEDAPDHLTVPTLEASYVNPRALTASASRDSRPDSENWWAGYATPCEDVQTLLAQCLTQVWCATRPIVILGHPGAGKSKLTEMLAARLPADDFLTVRVELRGVSANAPIRRQIEEAVSGQLHRDVAWRDLVESAHGALPVVILDGFDELLQTTGVNQSDYLEQVQQFQEDQATMGYPVAVIVTSRTVVADRVRFPQGCALVRLEPFSTDQIARMLDIWNATNAGSFGSRGVRPLSLETALRYRELTEQPLLFLMLLLYDADGNALENERDALSRSELYERMLTMFARREVVKHHPNLTEREMDTAVEGELNRLEVAAMAMFSRGRQSVAAEELERDLAVVLPDPIDRTGDIGAHRTLSEAHQVLGRFFFVHESRAHIDGRDSGVYEFLHATFAEYLVARMITTALGELADDRRRGARRRFAAPLDDGLLYALTSFAVLAVRAAVVEFTTELLRQRFVQDPDTRDDYRDLLIELFQDAPYPAPARSFTDYEPWRADILTRQASYTANLVTLLVCVCEEELDIARLFPSQETTWLAWRRMANQWRGLANEAWHGLVATVRIRHLGFWNGSGHTQIERERGDPVNVGECVGFEVSHDITRAPISTPYAITLPYDGVTSTLLRSLALRANGTAARTLLLLGPYFQHVSTDLLTWYSDHDDPDAAWNELHDVLELRLTPPLHGGPDRLRRYRRLVNARQLGRLELLVLRQAADDLDAASSGNRVEPLVALVRTIETYLAGLESVVSGPQLSREHVASVFERLRQHLNVPHHIEDLLDEHDRQETGEPERPGARGTRTPWQATANDSGYVRDRSVSPAKRGGSPPEGSGGDGQEVYPPGTDDGQNDTPEATRPARATKVCWPEKLGARGGGWAVRLVCGPQGVRSAFIPRPGPAVPPRSARSGRQRPRDHKGWARR